MDFNLFASTEIALSIENGALRMLVVRGGRVQSWMTYAIEPEVFKDGLVLSPTAFQTALSSLFFVRESIVGKISVCMPGNRSFFRTVTLPRFKPDLVAEAMNREAQREIPVNRDDVHLFWEPFGRGQDEQEFLMVGMQKEAYSRLYTGLRASKLKPRSWDLKPLALVRAVSRRNVVIADLEPGSTDLIVVTNGVPRLVRSLVEPSDLSPTDQGLLLAEHIAKTVAYYMASKSDEAWDPKTPVVLTGPLGGSLELIQAFQSASTYPVEPFLCPMPCPPDFTPSMYAATLGLVMKTGTSLRMGKRRSDFEVLSGKYRPMPLPTKKAAATIALAVGIGLFATGVQAKMEQNAQLEAKKSELAALQRQLTLTKLSVAGRAKTQTEISDTLALTETLKGERQTIIALGRDISGDLHTNLTVVPDEITLAKFLTQDSSLVVEGTSPNPATVFQYAQALEAEGRFDAVAITGLAKKTAADGASVTSFVVSLSK